MAKHSKLWKIPQKMNYNTLGMLVSYRFLCVLVKN